MIKQLTLAIALGGFLAGAASAQTTPAPAAPQAPAAQAAPAPTPAADLKVAASPEDCLKTAADLVLKAEEKKLADDKLDKIEDLLIKMETHCDARRFSEAHAMATDIKSLIETR